MTFDIVQMIAALEGRRMTWVGDGSQPDPLCTQAAAEIIRLTARVAEYDRVCADLVAHWDSTDWVNKPHTGEKIAAIRAALSTPTEETKT